MDPSRRTLPLIRPVALALLALVGGSSFATAQSHWYVDDNAAPGGNGLTWGTAFNTLDAALAASAGSTGHDDIWLAEGTYKPVVPPPPADPRTATFNVPDDTNILGAFLGTETTLPPLGLARNTVLSGDIGVIGTTTDNCYHVVTSSFGAGVPNGVFMNNVTIQNGNAGSAGLGGGVLLQGAKFTIEDSSIIYNQGGSGAGLYTTGGKTNLLRCELLGNAAATRGGALSGTTSFIDAYNCHFGTNSAGDGGAVSLYSSSEDGGGVPNNHFQNCRFNGNSASSTGGAILIYATETIGDNFHFYILGSGLFVNCTIASNTAGVDGGGIYCSVAGTHSGKCFVRDSIVWGNSAPSDPSLGGATYTVNYSDIQGGWGSGTGNINADPLFGTTQHISAGSPAIDAGNNAYVLADLFDCDGDGNTTEAMPVDLDGHPRFKDDPSTPDTGAGTPPIVDMGCFEF